MSYSPIKAVFLLTNLPSRRLERWYPTEESNDATSNNDKILSILFKSSSEKQLKPLQLLVRKNEAINI